MEAKTSFKSQELANRFSSKYDFIRYFSEVRKYLESLVNHSCTVQYYMPPSNMITKDFLRQVLEEKKRLLRMDAVRRINVPKYDELSVKNLFPKFSDDEALMSFMPDRMPKGKTIDREYFFNCLNTVKPEFVRDMVAHANKLRFSGGQQADEMDEVKCTDRMWEELN